MQIIVSNNFVEAPLVSVLIPSFNREDTIEETIISILHQKCDFPFELIIGDDHSTDNVRMVLLKYQKNYPQQIKLLFQDKNIGLGANWAYCVKQCRGKYICNCDNDDFWHNPDKLSLQVGYMESNKCGVVITDHRQINRKTGLISEKKAYINRTLPLQQAFFQGHTSFSNATVMYRSSVLHEHLNLDDFIKYQFTLQDWNTWVILAAFTDFHIIPVSTATVGIETVSITRPNNYDSIIRRFSKEKECYKYVCDLFPDKLIFDKIGYESYVLNVLLNLTFIKFDYSSARKYAKELKLLGSKSKKITIAHYRITFYLFAITKQIKQRFKD